MRSHCRGKVKFKSRSFESRFVVMHEIVGLDWVVIWFRSKDRGNEIIGKRKEEKGGYLFNELNARAVDTVAPSLMIIHVKIN